MVLALIIVGQDQLPLTSRSSHVWQSDDQGNYFNPFDRGVLKNARMFMHLVSIQEQIEVDEPGEKRCPSNLI